MSAPCRLQFERHRKELCHPERRKERKHKKRCGAKSCHAKLTLTNTIVCDVCQLKVCLTYVPLVCSRLVVGEHSSHRLSIGARDRVYLPQAPVP